MPDAPSVSVILPTLNAARTLDACLAALRAQDYDGEVEILLIDAGSTDGTLEIARRHGVDRVLDNPLRTGEAGKAVGIRAARGELVLSVDSDNTVAGSDWLRRMAAPFADPDVMAAEAARFERRPEDGAINRWHALLGAADPLTLYVGNYARDSALTGTWTGMPHETQQRDGWERVTLEPSGVPVLGANGFMIRRALLGDSGDYHFDLDAVHDLVQGGHRVVARVDVGVHHSFCDSVSGYWRKTRRRVDDFMYFSAQGARTYPWTASRRRGIAAFVLDCVLVLPLLRAAAAGHRRVPDRAWLFHPVACWITLVVYATGAIRGRLRPRILDRTGWRQ